MGFARILAGEPLDHPLASRIEGGYDPVFAAIAAEGLPRDELVLAWDFLTASDELLTRDILTMRDAALSLVGPTAENLTYDVAGIVNASPAIIRSLLPGTYDVPMFLRTGSPTCRCYRVTRRVCRSWWRPRANFAALVPRCVETAQLPVPTVLFGHGMFGHAEDSRISVFCIRSPRTTASW